jgi:hypothetical protein
VVQSSSRQNIYKGNAKAAAEELSIRSKGPKLAEEMHSLYKDGGKEQYLES